jgi:type II secretory ATPase GspE/PulE/Tfp pilus assembly ATPase PilB-like protein
MKNFDLVPYLKKVASTKHTQEENGSSTMRAPDVGPDGKPVVYLYRGKGCDRCGGSGYSGRIGIFEVLDLTEKISSMIMENVTDKQLEDAGIENGMLTMIQDGYLKALEGITTLEEVLRVSKE